MKETTSVANTAVAPLDIMDEVMDAAHDQFAEHQFKVETVQVMQDELDDLTGASKPIEVKLFGPDQTQLRQLARSVASVLEEKGAGHGLQEVNSNATGGNPDLMIRVDGERADRIGFKPEAVSRQMLRHVRGPDRRCRARIVDPHDRRARPLSQRHSFRAGPV